MTSRTQTTNHKLDSGVALSAHACGRNRPSSPSLLPAAGENLPSLLLVPLFRRYIWYVSRGDV